MTRLINDVQENVRRFNQEEAVWQRYEKRKRQRQKRLGPHSRLTERLFDRLEWLAADRETRSSDCVGKEAL